MPKPLDVLLTNEINLRLPEKELFQELKRRLTVDNPEYISAMKFGRSVRGLSRYIRLYSERNGTVSIPRGFWEEFLVVAQDMGYKLNITDNRVAFKHSNVREMELWDYQEPWVEDLLEHDHGIGVAPPGAGKTICALSVYARLGQPCLWLTHTKGLGRQVANRLQSFLGEEAGLIGSGTEDIKNFTVGLIPTLVRRDMSEYAKKFGLIILDESHHAPAPSFNSVVSAFWGKYRYGVTATPYRDDQLEELMFKTIGPARCYLDKQILRDMGKLMTPHVVRRPTNFDFPYNSMSKKYDYQALKNALALDEERNSLIVSDVVSEASIGNNTCIVLVGRIEHGEILATELSSILEGVGLIHSKQKPKESAAVMEAFEAGKLPILIATYKMLAEGFDYQPSNRLFLTADFKGRSLIEQACGRIERVYPGKTNALVYDYVDEKVGVLKNQAEVRLDVYEANETPVSTIEF